VPKICGGGVLRTPLFSLDFPPIAGIAQVNRSGYEQIHLFEPFLIFHCRSSETTSGQVARD
jgi:hypothetical protein